VVALAFAGNALGSDWTTVRKAFEYVDYAVLGLVVVGIVYAIVRRRRRDPADGSTDTPPVPDAG
jgi:membrane protein DedA with SNARE-associated domain